MRTAFALLFFCNLGFAQSKLTDSVYVIKQFELKSDKAQFYKKASKNQNIDSTTANLQHLSLAEIISRKTPVFIKNYGQGALATMSFRGTSANQTAIIWNGFNLQSAMNGTADLSLIPAFLLDNVTVNYGGESALYGSGAIGGVIQLHSQPKFNQGFSAQFYSSYNSLLDRLNGVKIHFSNSKYSAVVKYLNQDNKNEYRFYNYLKNNSPIEIQKNAAQKSNALLLENYWNLPAQQTISVKAWYQKSNRTIPSTLASNTGSANQQDENLRVCGEWMKYWNKTKISVRAANLTENIIYVDSISFSNSTSRANTSIFESDFKREVLPKQYLEIGTTISYISAESKGYTEIKPIVKKQALLLSYKGMFFNKISGIFSARQEVFNGKIVPFTFSGSLYYSILNRFEIFVKGSKNYRLPTFNDLYWQPGGNINLLPEQGYCGEVGLNYEIKKNKNILRFENTIYSKKIKNWIIWLPQFGYWSPENVLQVWSRGYETALNGNITLHKLVLLYDVRYNYSLSTNTKTKSIHDAALNKQLIYVPIYNAQSTLGIMFKQFKIDYNFTYTYYRYTTSDNFYYLEPYQLSNVTLSYKSKQFKNCYALLSAQVNNLFNAQYQVISGKPMPLRYYQLSASINFNKNKN